MSFMMLVGLAITTIALIGVPLLLIFDRRTSRETLPRLAGLLLIVAAVLSCLMTLFILPAAAWGMETRIPWGLGIYPYLIPALSFPAFLILRFWSASVLAKVFWCLTITCSIAWYFGDKANRAFDHLPPVADPRERLGMCFNVFTLSFILISVLVQLAALCRWRLDQRSPEVPRE